MTMQHRIADCYWQMRLPLIDYGSDVTIALTRTSSTRPRAATSPRPAIKR